MEEIIVLIDWQNYFYPHIPVTLRNLVGENKCSLNAVLQSLKACPAFRNFVHSNLRNRSWKNDLPVVAIFQDPLCYSFWESFLSNDLRHIDPNRDMSRSKQEKSMSGFFGEKNYNNSRFALLDAPWDAPVFGFNEQFEIADVNDMLDIHDIVGCFNSSLCLTDSQVFIMVCHDHEKENKSCYGQEDGVFIRVNPLLPSDREDKLYAQVDKKGSINKNRIQLEDKFYRTDLQKLLQEMSDKRDFVISNTGDILIIESQVRLERNAFLFLESGANSVSESYIQNVVDNLHGFRVVSKLIAPPFLYLQEEVFVLSSMINNEAKNHYTAHTNGDHNQQWWNFDDEKLKALSSQNKLQQTQGLSAPNSVCFFYQRVRLKTTPSIDLLKSLKMKLESFVRNPLRIRSDNERWHRILLPYKNTRINKILGTVSDYSISSIVVDMDVVDGIIDENGHRANYGCEKKKTVITTTSSKSVVVATGEDPPTKRSRTASDTLVRVGKTNMSTHGTTDNVADIGNEKDLVAAVDPHNLINKTFYYLDGIVPFQGVVESCSRNKKGNLCYTLYFDKDDTDTIVTYAELQSLMLNGPNGSIFGGKGREHIVTEVKAYRIKTDYSHLSRHSPSHFEFQIRWDNAKKCVWGTYDRSQFTTKVMQAFLKTHQLYSSFKRHYDNTKKDTWLHYRVGVETATLVEHIKITMADGTKVNKTMREATEFFGKDGISRIKKQFKLLSANKSRAWFHVSTGLEVDSGAGLITGEDKLVSHDDVLYSDTYDWKLISASQWLKLKVMKTRGKFCILVNSLNILDVSPLEAEQIFSSFRGLHTSKGEIDISTCFIELSKLNLLSYYFKYTKCKSLMSFGQLSLEMATMRFGNAAVVCYKTSFGTTHAICWDVVRKKLLDCEHHHDTVFEYNEFNKNSSIVKQFLVSLGTTIDVPCILYVGYWLARSVKESKKRKIFPVFV